MRRVAFALVSAAFLSACLCGEPEGPVPLHTVSGTVTRAGAPVANAEVSFVYSALRDSPPRYDGTTDENGHYSVFVPEGTQGYSARSLGTDAEFAVTAGNVVVDGDVELPIALPRPLALEVGEVTADHVTLHWAATDVPGFQLYRLVTGTREDLENGGGKLIRTLENLDDVEVIDEDLSTAPAWAYQLFAVGDVGTEVGSAIVDVAR